MDHNITFALIPGSPSLNFGVMLAAAMNEPDEAPRRYRWPWVALAFVVLGIVMALIFMIVAVKKIERERDYSAPLPGTAPLR
jgi:hypothetical protein